MISDFSSRYFIEQQTPGGGHLFPSASLIIRTENRWYRKLSALEMSFAKTVSREEDAAEDWPDKAGRPKRQGIIPTSSPLVAGRDGHLHFKTRGLFRVSVLNDAFRG